MWVYQNNLPGKIQKIFKFDTANFFECTGWSDTMLAEV